MCPGRKLASDQEVEGRHRSRPDWASPKVFEPELQPLPASLVHVRFRAHPSRCCWHRRTAVDRTQSGRSGLAAGTGLHPLWRPLSLYSIISPARGSRRPARKRERQTTTRCSVSGDCRGGEKDFCQATWERTGWPRPILAKILYCRWIRMRLVNGCRATGSDLSAHRAQPGDRGPPRLSISSIWRRPLERMPSSAPARCCPTTRRRNCGPTRSR